MPTRVPTYCERCLLRATTDRRQAAHRWLPRMLHDDSAAQSKLDQLLQRPPVNWLTVLAGMPSTRWLALLRPRGAQAQHLRYGPTTAQATDLGRVLCGLQDDTWLQHRYCGPLNYTGQERLEQQSAAIHRLLSRLVASHRDADLILAVHIAGDPVWQLHHSPAVSAQEALESLIHVVARFGIYAPGDTADGEEFA